MNHIIYRQTQILLKKKGRKSYKRRLDQNPKKNRRKTETKRKLSPREIYIKAYHNGLNLNPPASQEVEPTTTPPHEPSD